PVFLNQLPSFSVFLSSSTCCFPFDDLLPRLAFTCNGKSDLSSVKICHSVSTTPLYGAGRISTHALTGFAVPRTWACSRRLTVSNGRVINNPAQFPANSANPQANGCVSAVTCEPIYVATSPGRTSDTSGRRVWSIR